MTTLEIAEFMQSEGRVKFDEIIRDSIDIEKVFNLIIPRARSPMALS